jgi:hypothetical protein
MPEQIEGAGSREMRSLAITMTTALLTRARGLAKLNAFITPLGVKDSICGKGCPQAWLSTVSPTSSREKMPTLSARSRMRALSS